MSEEIKEVLEEVNKILDNTAYNEYFTYFDVNHISKILDYISNLQQKVEQLENIRKEAIEECKSVIGNPEHTIVSKNELMKIMLNILNKGSESDE